MQGAAVAMALKRAQKTGKEKTSDLLNEILHGETPALNPKLLEDVEGILEASATAKLFGLSDHEQTEELEVKQMDGLIAKAKELEFK
ncbi:hypothetical protein T484DRAFT_1772254 [Baffinella frigidus]|nr:hypothetical protein T484DRAFT_1772254 [Cryptophyta sp. CCMP2293]